MKLFYSLLLVFSLILIGSAQCQPFNIEASVGGRIVPGGAEIDIDLPESQHLRNKAGTDGAGLCVWTSIDHASRWQNIEILEGIRDYMTKFPGGGWPQRVDKVIPEIAKKKGVPVPQYIQAQGGRELLPLLKKAIDTGRIPCITYGISPTGRYNGRTIAHMVNMVHYGKDGTIGILDNNYPGINNYEYMSEDQFVRTFTTGGGGWCVIFLASGPPNLPFNQ